MNTKLRVPTLWLVTFIIIIGFVVACSIQQDEKNYYQFTKKDELVRPVDYRTWVFAGTGTSPLSLDSNVVFPDFQNIYIDPPSYAFWKENGYYREGTIFVKELIRKGETVSPIGKGFWQGEAYSLSATVKDSTRFSYAPGGWEYFKFTDYDKGVLTASSPALGGNCINCHSRTEAGYGPFTDLYMPLRDAKKFGKGAPENEQTRKGLAARMPALLQERE